MADRDVAGVILKRLEGFAEYLEAGNDLLLPLTMDFSEPLALLDPDAEKLTVEVHDYPITDEQAKKLVAESKMPSLAELPDDDDLFEEKAMSEQAKQAEVGILPPGPGENWHERPDASERTNCGSAGGQLRHSPAYF